MLGVCSNARVLPLAAIDGETETPPAPVEEELCGDFPGPQYNLKLKTSAGGRTIHDGGTCFANSALSFTIQMTSGIYSA